MFISKNKELAEKQSIALVRTFKQMKDYILECNKDFDAFFKRHLNEVECMDIN